MRLEMVSHLYYNIVVGVEQYNHVFGYDRTNKQKAFGATV